VVVEALCIRHMWHAHGGQRSSPAKMSCNTTAQSIHKIRAPVPLRSQGPCNHEWSKGVEGVRDEEVDMDAVVSFANMWWLLFQLDYFCR